MSTIPQISMLDLSRMIPQLTAQDLILDVRTPEEFREGHVAGAKNIPLDQVVARADELKSYARVYVHCQAGRRAGIAVQGLVAQGVTHLVCVSLSGMGEWIANGLPVQKG